MRLGNKFGTFSHEIMKKILRLALSLSLLLAVASATAQNLPYADYKRFHFGFSLGLNFLDFNLTPSNMVIDGKTYQADVSSLMPGFSVALISDLRLNDYFNLRLNPALHFGDRTISYYSPTDGERFNTGVKSAIITVPLYVKFSAFRVHDYKPYIIAGGGVAFDCYRDKRMPVILNMFDYFVDFGAGCTIYFPYFRFAPEIRFAIGFNDLLEPFEKRKIEYQDPDMKRYNQALSRITSQMFILTFNFE